MNYNKFSNIVPATGFGNGPTSAPLNIADRRYIVGSVNSDGGGLSLSPNPAQHMTLEDAAKEADRLVNLPDNARATNPRKFVIFEALELVSTPPRPTNSVRVSLRDNKGTA